MLLHENVTNTRIDIRLTTNFNSRKKMEG